MKILQVIPFFSPKYGGTVNSTYILSKELSKTGHEVTILTTNINQDKKYIGSIEKEGVIVVNLPYVFNFGLLIYSPEIKKWLDVNLKNFDIIHMHNFRSYQNNVVMTYAKKFNIPYILQARGSVLPIFEKQKLKKLYDLVWGNKILKNAAAVIALTKEEARQYIDMGVDKDKIKIIPNSIESNVSDNLKKGNFRSKYNINDNEQIILYLGRLNKIKGIDLLVEAFADLNKNLSDIRLVIVGPEDGFREDLKSLIKKYDIEDQIVFTGPLHDDKKFEAYLDADIYVLPSRYETFPNTVLESSVCGTPVIITDRCGIADFVEGNMGVVVECNKKGLRDAILNFLKDEDKMIELGNKGKTFVKKNLDSKIVSQKINTLYTDISNSILKF